MSFRQLGAAVFVLVMLVSFVNVQGMVTAHSPEFPHDNYSLSTAWDVHDPSKSWAIYGDLPSGAVQYYQMEFQAGGRILLDLIVPVDEGKRGFIPSMALLGPGLIKSGVLPRNVEKPQGYGHIVIPGGQTETVEFEPFSPSGFYDLAKYDQVAQVTGIYYVVIWEPPTGAGEGGRYGFPVGFTESFTLEEMVTIPYSLVGVSEWTGQSLVSIFLPMIIVLVAGAAYLRLRSKIFSEMDHGHLIVMMAGLMIVGSGAITMFQLILTALYAPISILMMVTVAIFLVQMILGISLWRATIVNRAFNRSNRAMISIVGLVALFVWAGYIIGPAIALLGAILPRTMVDGEKPL